MDRFFQPNQMAGDLGVNQEWDGLIISIDPIDQDQEFRQKV